MIPHPDPKVVGQDIPQTSLHNATVMNIRNDLNAISGECPGCGSAGMSVFYRVKDVPVHSVLLMKTCQEALDYRKGHIELAFCRTCGFISNLAFDPSSHEYSSRYEETQGFSPTFNAFHQSLAKRLIERYDLHDKDILEIGCGKGEFLTLICELGGNRGVGFDAAYMTRRSKCEALNA